MNCIKKLRCYGYALLADFETLKAQEITSTDRVVRLVFVFLMNQKQAEMLLKMAAILEMMNGKHAFLVDGLVDDKGLFPFGSPCFPNLILYKLF